MKIIIEGEPKEVSDLAMELQNQLSSKGNKSFKYCSPCGAKYRLGFYAREFVDVYIGLENERKEVVESFIYEVLNVALPFRGKLPFLPA